MLDILLHEMDKNNKKILNKIMNSVFKEVPMLFSTPMVQAYMAGTKTQTRRTKGLDTINNSFEEYKFKKIVSFDGNLYAVFRLTEGRKIREVTIKCPYGQIGDILWVRETWKASAYYPEDKVWSIKYMAGGHDNSFPYDSAPTIKHFKNWQPSIFMKKCFSRFRAQIVNIRVERLKKISKQDAIDEGIICSIEFDSVPFYQDYNKHGQAYKNPVLSYRSLWESINGIGSWQKNPWVWVVEFKRIEKPLNK